MSEDSANSNLIPGGLCEAGEGRKRGREAEEGAR